MAEPKPETGSPGAVGAVGAVGGTSRLSGPEVEQRLTSLDRLLGQLEQMPGPGSELALDAVATLTAVYGEALARIMTRLSAVPAAAADLAADELLGRLLILHGLSPVPARQRAVTAVAEIRPFVKSRGGDIRLVDVDMDGGVARVQISGHCQGCSSPATVHDAVTETILAAVPELASVEIQSVPAAAEQALIPVDAVLRSRRAPT
jgi:Fe-S cluster biogenesis protein NfuA